MELSFDISFKAKYSFIYLFILALHYGLAQHNC